jgi:nucleoside-diphosphate-sugar epimerase
MTGSHQGWSAHLRGSSRAGRVLLTGASGVVGDAVLVRLGRHDVTCLTHRARLDRPGVQFVSGDLTADRLGLDPSTYDELAAQVDTVVHCAAVTQFNRRDGSLERTNIAGTEQIVAFAERAGAHLVHVSTAFLHAADGDRRGGDTGRYAASKRAGEDVVRAGAAAHVILRPSIVIGHSRTGYIKAFQGLHMVAGAVLGGVVPIAPFDPRWRLDFVPGDVVADAVVVAAERRLTGEHWLTAGPAALTLGAAMEVVESLGRELGQPIDPVRFVPPDVYDRLFAPVFLDALPIGQRRIVVKLVEFFTAYLAMDEALPSDLPALAAQGVAPLGDLGEALTTSLRHWARATGRARPVASEAG